MLEANVQRALGLIKPGDVVLDIGGWACPFNRADYVLDAGPYDTRGYYRTFGGAPSQGGATEHFSRETWIQRDICEHTPFPFADKSIDWVICSHTLEDIRDPLWVCQEMMRIGRRGYIEVPSRATESSRGASHPRIAGLTHHRWLIDIDMAGQDISFLMKPHLIHAHWRFSLSAGYARSLSDAGRVQWLWWEDRFTCHEVTIHGEENWAAELERFVASVRPYAAWRLALASLWSSVRGLGARVSGRLRRSREVEERA